MRHPQVGELFLRREKLDIAGTDGLQVVIYHAEPGTQSAQALALLGSIAATGERDAADRAAAEKEGPEKDGPEKDGAARAPAPAGRHGSSNPERETP